MKTTFNKELIERTQKAEEIIKNNPDVLRIVKTIAWWAVQEAHRLEHKENVKIIRRDMIENYIDSELGLVD